MKTPNNKKATQQLEILLQQQAEKIAQLERGQAIEVALDKVRARTMTMQHPDELREVVAVLQEQITTLQIADWGSNILIAHEEGLIIEHWIASFNQAQYPESYLIKGKEHEVIAEYWAHYYAQTPHFTIALTGEKRISYNEYVFTYTDLKRFPTEIKAHISTLSESYFCYARMKYGHLAALGTAPLSEENFIILQRFAKVFEQSYTRFLDLKRAKAQARAAKIDAAIERIRAKALAMHHSYEVKDVANAMRTELMNLGIAGVSAATIWIEQSKDKVRAWDFTSVQEVADSKDLGVDLVLDLEKGRAHPKAYFWNVWNNRNQIYSVVESNKETLYASMNWLVELDETMGKEMLHLVDTGQLTYWWHASAAIKKGTITIDFAAPPPVEMAIILPKMAAAFDLAYRRFEDLQKAEAQTREAQIEVALERVRAKTMAMHKTEDLREVVGVLYEQVNLLNLADEGCNINIFREDINSIETWMAGFDGISLPDCYYMEGQAHPFLQRQWDNWRVQAPPFHISTAGKELEKYAKYIVEETDLKRIPDDFKEMMLSSSELHFSFITFKYGQIEIVNTATSPSQENLQVLTRFAKVFEQTYTRFLDLQKAEAQAKEAQIETALERVRAQTMAMHKSEELRFVISMVFEQLNGLGFDAYACGLVLYDKEDKSYTLWIAGFETDNYAQSYRVPYFIHPYYNAQLEAWESGNQYATIVFEGDLKKSYDAFVFEHSDFKHLPQSAKDAMTRVETTTICDAYMTYGMLEVVVEGLESISETQAAILQRFAKVFEQTYTRFLDIQKAEAQAKEAQIEAALERVRAQTMAMHKSAELSEVVKVLYQEIKPFGFAAFSCTIHLLDKKTQNTEVWMEDITGTKHLQSYYWYGRENSIINQMWEAWEQQLPIWDIHLKAEEKRNLDNYLFEKTDYQQFPKEVKNQIRSSNEVYFTMAYFKHGYISVTGFIPPLPSQKEIIQRFAKVFDQTYTRFLDLQRAEAQAREAQIEAALERVRARAMAMHKSEELQEVVAIFFQQYKKINQDTISSWISLVDPIANTLKIWTTNGDIVSAVTAHGEEQAEFQKVINAWRQKENIQFSIEKKMAKKILKNKFGLVLQPPKNKSHFHLLESLHNFGYVGLGTWDESNEANQAILQRFAKVFEQTYTRFLDLQKAEAQAREAQIEAALERVRSASMAMQTSGALGTILGKMLEEMTFLDINLVRAIIWTFHPEERITKWWGGHQENKNIAKCYTTKYEVQAHHPFFKAYIKAWKAREKMFVYQLAGAEKESWDDILFLDSEMKNLPDEVIIGMREPKTVYASNSFNEFGVLMISSLEPLADTNLAIIQRFSSLFEQTYRRFLDVQEAEERAREAQIEAALERVRARAMAMRHSDELSEAAELLYHEFFKLGVEPFSCGYLINDDEKGGWKIWLTNPGEPFFKQYWTIPYTADHNLQARYESWKNKEAFHCAVLEGAENQAHHQVICQYAPWKEEVTPNLTPQLVFNSAHFSLGHLLVISPDRLSSELEQAMVRFAGVFDLTYRRFLDLEKAEEQNRQLEKVFNENQRLLHSILPEQIAEQIRKGEQTVVKRFEAVSILFADIVGFTVLSEKLSPQEVVDILNGLFSKFDDLTDKYQLEKIKTIGDAYMVAAGVPEEKDNHAHTMFAFAKEMLQTLQAFNQAMGGNLKIRIGISSGPVVAGVIGKKKFAYDLWGDTVNTAARMEANGRADCIQVSPTTYTLLKKETAFEKIPNVEIKGKGLMDVYLWTP